MVLSLQKQRCFSLFIEPALEWFESFSTFKYPRFTLEFIPAKSPICLTLYEIVDSLWDLFSYLHLKIGNDS